MRLDIGLLGIQQGPDAAWTQAPRDALSDLARAGHPHRVVADVVECIPAYVSQQIFRARR